LWRYGKNRHITQNISEYPGPILTYFTPLVGILVGMICEIFIWQSPKGRCYGNQLNLEDVRKRHVEWPLLVASAFDNGLANRKFAFNRFNGSNQATLYPNVENLTSNDLEVYAVKTRNFCRDSPAIWRRYSFVKLACRNRLEDRSVNFSRVIGNHLCTPGGNLVRFGSVTPEFVRFVSSGAAVDCWQSFDVPFSLPPALRPRHGPVRNSPLTLRLVLYIYRA